MPEPFGMLSNVGVVGRALEGDVERDLDPQSTGGRDQMVEILEGPEVGMDRLMTASFGADRPRAAVVVRAGVQRVIGALAEAPPDRMYRGKVEHVEIHPGDVGEL